MNECVECCEPLFGDSSVWWTENWREKIAKPKQGCWASVERFSKVKETRKSKTTTPRWES